MNTFLYATAVAASAFAVSLGVLSATGADAPAETHAMDAACHASLEHEVCMSDAASGMDHAHPLREVAEGAPVPTVTHLVFPDAMDGYNIQILTQNFDFTPAAINSTVVDNAGHAHLYVNGEKVSRVYGNWVHLPSDTLVAGANAVSITLNANDHSEWSVGGAPVASTVIVHVPGAAGTGDS